MNLSSALKKISMLKKAFGFSVRLILLAAILVMPCLAKAGNDTSVKSASVASQSLEVTLSADCLTSTSITDFLFNASLDSNLFSEFSIDLFTQKASNCVAFFVNGYTRNPFYTFIATNAP